MRERGGMFTRPRFAPVVGDRTNGHSWRVSLSLFHKRNHDWTGQDGERGRAVIMSCIKNQQYSYGRKHTKHELGDIDNFKYDGLVPVNMLDDVEKGK